MTKEYICKRCGYITKFKYSLRAHLLKKNECLADLENIEREKLIEDLDSKKEKIAKVYNCDKCNKEFANRQNKWKHEKICKVEKKIDKITELENKIKELESKQHITINNTNNTTNNNIIINNLRPFGEENYDFVNSDMVKKIVDPCSLFLYNFVKLIHFNKEHPENWNYYINNTRTNKALIYREDVFNIEDKNDTLRELINRKKAPIKDLIKKLDNLLSVEKTKIIDALERFEKSGDASSSITENLLKKTEDLAYNMRHMIDKVKRELDKQMIEDCNIIIK